jgi:hypothetical protein
MSQTQKENQEPASSRDERHNERRHRPYRTRQSNDDIATQLTEAIMDACQRYTLFASDPKLIKGSLQEGATMFHNNIELLKHINNNSITQQYYRLGEHIFRETPSQQLIAHDTSQAQQTSGLSDHYWQTANNVFRTFMGYYDLILFLKNVHVRNFRKVSHKTLNNINRMIRQELGDPTNILGEPIELPDPAFFDFETEQ